MPAEPLCASFPPLSVTYLFGLYLGSPCTGRQWELAVNKMKHPPPFNGTDVLGGGEQEGDEEMSLEG